MVQWWNGIHSGCENRFQFWIPGSSPGWTTVIQNSIKRSDNNE